MDDSIVVVEMSVDEIKEKSVIFTNGSKIYHDKMNKASFELCLDNPALCNNKQQLMEMCRQKLDQEGYSYSKKRSRSKIFGSESTENSCVPKKKKMSADIRAKRIEELTADITSLGDRMKLLEKQKSRDEQLKQYLRASSMEEEIAKLRSEKRKKEEEVMLIQKKQAMATWYREKHSSASSSSDEKCKIRPLSTFWAKNVVTVDEAEEKIEESTTSAPDIQVVECAADTSSDGTANDADNDKSTFL